MNAGNLIPGRTRTCYTPLYDTLILAASAAFGTKQTFFGRLAGSDGAHVTNMSKAFELQSPEKMLCQALRIVVVRGALADLRELAEEYVVRLIVNNITQLEAPMEYFPGGAGWPGMVAALDSDLATTTQFGNNWANGTPDPRAVANNGRHPIAIEHGNTFRVEIVQGGSSGLTTSDALTLRVYLDGEYTKGQG